MDLSAKEIALIKEEENNLRRLQMGFALQIKDSLRDDIMKEIADVNEQIPEVNADELPQVKAQLNRLDAILKQMDSIKSDKLDVMNPYFGRMKLQDQGGIKDFYLGNQVYRDAKNGIQIIDWKSSPISRIYFLYDEGDEYEEEIQGKSFAGEIVCKRILRVVDGKIREIQTSDTLLRKHTSGEWQRSDSKRYILKGGAGKASRPENAATGNPKFGFASNDRVRKSKFLPEITALIDPEQFELITQPETGVVAIQGVAGSGKTTVALHRVSWLHFQDSQRFPAANILVMVFNKALASYISKVLPSMGVDGVGIENFEDWVSELRIRLFSGYLPRIYSEHTPVTVIRFKKHPVLFTLMADYIRAKTETFSQGISAILDEQQQRTILRESVGLPLIPRIFKLYEWVTSNKLTENLVLPAESNIKTRLLRHILQFFDPEKDRMALLLDFWEDLFTDYAYLQKGFSTLTSEFSPSQLLEVVDWLKHQHAALSTKDPVAKKDLMEIMAEGSEVKTAGAVLDYEDDPILLYLYQSLFKDIVTSNKKLLRYDHIMIDEVQDFSPVELAVLINLAKDPLSLTLAGDVNQKMIQESGFMSWESTFETLGIKGQKVSALRIGYRSTYEIMEFSMKVLSELAEKQDFAATRHGPPVELFQFSSQGELLQYLSRCLQDTMVFEPLASIAVICATPDAAREYFGLLEAVEIADLRLIDDQNFPFIPGIDVTDVRQVKGLEFDYVILLDVDVVNYTNDTYAKYLLHIAASRAAHQLWIMNHRASSSVIPEEYRVSEQI